MIAKTKMINFFNIRYYQQKMIKVKYKVIVLRIKLIPVYLLICRITVHYKIIITIINRTIYNFKSQIINTILRDIITNIIKVLNIINIPIFLLLIDKIVTINLWHPTCTIVLVWQIIKDILCLNSPIFKIQMYLYMILIVKDLIQIIIIRDITMDLIENLE